MGMIFHGVADDIGHLVVAAVFEFIHGVEDATLDGFEPVIDVRNSAFEDNVGGVVQKPIAVEIVDGFDLNGGGVLKDGLVGVTVVFGLGCFFGHCEKSGKV